MSDAPSDVPPMIAPDLGKRVVSTLVLAPLAIGAAYFGGLPWVTGMGIVALLLFREWNRLTRAPRLDAAALLAALAILGTAVLLALHWHAAALALLALALVGSLVPATVGRDLVWAARGTAYALALLVPTVLLRASPELGFSAILFLFAVVWATDICAFFAGRAIGGPKLWPAISPRKTWAGFVGGCAGAGVAALTLVLVLGLPHPEILLALALALSLAAHAGDLFESWVKRTFHQKDSGHLIPGHGGVMDRLDGFIVAATFALVLGLARGGASDVAGGLLRW